MRYLHLIGVFIRGSFQSEAAYRFNFASNLLNTVLNLAGSIGGIAVVFFNRETLNGWSFSEASALLGVYLFVIGMKNLVIGPGLEALSGLSGELWSGSFDHTLLKPLPVQFYVSLRKWSLWSVIDVLLAAVIIVISLFTNSSRYSSKVFISCLFPLSLLFSLVLVYSILLVLASAAFWYLGTQLMWLFDSLIQTGRFPVGIYPGFFRFLLTWLIPVGIIITFPARIIAGMTDIALLAGSGLLSVLMFAIASVVFKLSIRKYSSASS
jgi:ABC-2 type transport system permease protein